MKGCAARAAVGFIVVAFIVLGWVAVIIATFPAGLYRPFLYTVAAGVCVAIAWPKQADGEALLRGDD